MDQPFIGAIFLIGANFAPYSWALCDGRQIAISQNETLYTLIGTTYGGDGLNTFNLPDLRGRVPIHQGQGPGLQNYVIGATAGTENVTFTAGQIPSHNHNLNIQNAVGNTPTPASNTVLAVTVDGSGSSATPVKVYTDQIPDTALNSQTITNTGGGQSISIIQPLLAMNYIFALYGVYPSRN